jgi:transcriptional regulator with XRE-family HTH domain
MVGLRIKTVRRQRGLSQAQLAHPELSDSYVSLIESGKRTPTPAVLELLAQKLDCSLSYLLNGVTAEQMEDIELALGYARLALENGEVSEARTRFAELLQNNNLTGLTMLRQDTQFGLALAVEAAGDTAEAIAILTRLREEGVAPDRRIEIAIALCRAHRENEQLSEAVEIGEQILIREARPTWTDLLVELGATLLGAYLQRGDLLRARQFAAELLNAAEVLGSPRSAVAANWNAAFAAFHLGFGDEAVMFAERAMAIQEEHGQPRNIARMRVALGQTRLRSRPQDAAVVRELQEKAYIELVQSSASLLDQANCRIELGKAEIIDGEFEAGIGHIIEGRSLVPPTVRSVGAEADLLLANAFASKGRFSEAEERMVAVREWLSGLPESRRLAGTWYAAAETLDQLGSADAAVEAYERALACAGL